MLRTSRGRNIARALEKPLSGFGLAPGLLRKRPAILCITLSLLTPEHHGRLNRLLKNAGPFMAGLLSRSGSASQRFRETLWSTSVGPQVVGLVSHEQFLSRNFSA